MKQQYHIKKSLVLLLGLLLLSLASARPVHASQTHEHSVSPSGLEIAGVSNRPPPIHHGIESMSELTGWLRGSFQNRGDGEIKDAVIIFPNNDYLPFTTIEQNKRDWIAVDFFTQQENFYIGVQLNNGSLVKMIRVQSLQGDKIRVGDKKTIHFFTRDEGIFSFICRVLVPSSGIKNEGLSLKQMRTEKAGHKIEQPFAFFPIGEAFSAAVQWLQQATISRKDPPTDRLEYGTVRQAYYVISRELDRIIKEYDPELYRKVEQEMASSVGLANDSLRTELMRFQDLLSNHENKAPMSEIIRLRKRLGRVKQFVFSLLDDTLRNSRALMLYKSNEQNIPELLDLDISFAQGVVPPNRTRDIEALQEALKVHSSLPCPSSPSVEIGRGELAGIVQSLYAALQPFTVDHTARSVSFCVLFCGFWASILAQYL